jgi:hypothetical protein
MGTVIVEVAVFFCITMMAASLANHFEAVPG